MATILCLAHFCELHGPTPLMVTEGQPVGCDSCHDDDHAFNARRPSTSSASVRSSQDLQDAAKGANRPRSADADKENHALRNRHVPATPPTVETPPESPRVLALQSTQKANSVRRNSSSRKTWEENEQKQATPCENCALTLPKKNEQSPLSANAPGKKDNVGPILRTRIPYERVTSPMPRNVEPSPPKSNSSDSSDSDEPVNTSKHTRRHSRITTRAGTSSSNSSFSSTVSHNHNVDYISTHEPLSPVSFSMIRQSALRTLSCETLLPSTSPTVSSPTSPRIDNPFSSGPATPSASIGGPIMFGDRLAGYTTAYIFRIPDPTSRGRRRVYALMALSTHREELAIKSFSILSNAFRNLAQWITDLAAKELERSQNLSPSASHSSTFNSSAQSSFSTNSLNYPSMQGGSNSSPYQTPPTSSFLSSRSNASNYMGVPRGKGLAELTGLPDFFFELHKRFVMLLVDLARLLNRP